MPDERRAPSPGWPQPRFYFKVTWGDTVMSFQEVSGLDVEAQPIEYRRRDSREFSTIKMPGLAGQGHVTLKKGIFAGDRELWDRFNALKTNTTARMPITISLLDEDQRPTMVWTLQNAFPVKVSGADLRSDGNEVAIETIEIAHEGVQIANR